MVSDDREPCYRHGHFMGIETEAKIGVIDTPPFYMVSSRDTCNKIAQFMSERGLSVNSFLILWKFGTRDEEHFTVMLQTLHEAFGDQFLDKILIVVTHYKYGSLNGLEPYNVTEQLNGIVNEAYRNQHFYPKTFRVIFYDARYNHRVERETLKHQQYLRAIRDFTKGNQKYHPGQASMLEDDASYRKRKLTAMVDAIKQSNQNMTLTTRNVLRFSELGEVDEEFSIHNNFITKWFKSATPIEAMSVYVIAFVLTLCLICIVVSVLCHKSKARKRVDFQLIMTEDKFQATAI